MTLDFTIGALANPRQEYFLNDQPRPAQSDNWTMRAIDANFEFRIEGICVLQEEYWSVGELAMQLTAWLRAGLPSSFHYDCLDAEETDLFTFERHGQDFLFYSEWQETPGKQVVSQHALAQFIAQFAATVQERIQLDLGLNARHYLGN
ncbi:MAG: hypothetical protein ACRYFX_23130 [Janthinobacterium lividum]